MRLSIYEILKLANSKSKLEERVAILNQYDCYALWKVLRIHFHPNIKWLVSGDVEFKTGSIIDQEGSLYAKIRQIYLFTKGDEKENLDIEQSRRDLLWIQFLEGIDKKDAELLISLANGKMPFANITEKVALAVYPGLYN